MPTSLGISNNLPRDSTLPDVAEAIDVGSAPRSSAWLGSSRRALVLKGATVHHRTLACLHYSPTTALASAETMREALSG